MKPATQQQQAVFESIVKPIYIQAAAVFPNLPDARAKLDWEAGTFGRAFGFFEPATNTIAISPRLLREPAGRIVGVIRHEIGHLVHESIGRAGLVRHLGQLPDSDEILADQIAEYIWASPIFYDAEDVQTVDPMQAYSRVRPSYLPNPQIDLFGKQEKDSVEPIDRSTMKQLAKAVPEVELEPSVDYPQGEPFGEHPWPSPALFDEGENFYLRPYFLHREPTPNVLIHRRSGARVGFFPHPFMAKYALRVAESLGDIPVIDDPAETNLETRQWLKKYESKMGLVKRMATCPDLSCKAAPGLPCKRPSGHRPSAAYSSGHHSRVDLCDAMIMSGEILPEDVPGFA